eukprot:c26929_g1_i2 orf=651-4022(-)
MVDIGVKPHRRGGSELWHSQSLERRRLAPEVDNLVAESVKDNVHLVGKTLQVSQRENRGFWKWKPLRAIAHSGQQRFHVIFWMQVHCIEGLPSAMNDHRVAVHWRRDEEGVQTMPCSVVRGVVTFEETLRLRCTVYGGAKSSDHGMKYESKFFTLVVVGLDTDGVEFGRHRLDLSQMLPQYLGDDRKTSNWTTDFSLTGKAKGGRLNVTFGYDLVHLDIDDDHATDRGISESMGSSQSLGDLDSLLNSELEASNSQSSNPLTSHTYTGLGMQPGHFVEMEHDDIPRNGNPPRSSNEAISFQRSGLPAWDTSSGSKSNLTIFSEDALDTPTSLAKKRTLIGSSSHGDWDEVCQRFEDDFVVEERGIEVGSLGNSATNTGGKFEDFQFWESNGRGSGGMWNEEDNKSAADCREGDSVPEEAVHFVVGKAHGESQQLGNKNGSASCAEQGMEHSDSDLDDEAEQVAGEFLQMLDIESSPLGLISDSDPNSPRALLLKQFEQEVFFDDGMALGIDTTHAAESSFHDPVDSGFPSGSGLIRRSEDSNRSWGFEEDLKLASIMEVAESELQKAKQAMHSKTRATMLEDAETQALMQQWGLSEKAFQSSPPKSAPGFCHPMRSSLVHMPQPPPLAPGLGSVIAMRDGGTLRSMSPSHFQNGNCSGRLVMQASRPVVVPAEMGFSAVDILKHLASAGVENMALQAMVVMPLEDITGRTVEEISAKGSPEVQQANYGDDFSFENRNRYPSLDAYESQRRLNNLEYGNAGYNTRRRLDPMKANTCSPQSGLGRHNGMGAFDECVFLDDLAPLAMQNIEALAMDGLKIQTDMAEDEAPSYLDAAAWGALDDLKRREEGGIGMLQGVAGVHFLDKVSSGKEISKHSEGLLQMAITLDDWAKLDAGVLDESEVSDKTLAVLAAHNANHRNLLIATDKNDRNKGSHGRSSQRQTSSFGVMGNTLMIAMLVQLRDPFRNNEPVGAPMMALVQAERVVIPPKPKVGKRVSTSGNSEEDEEAKQLTEQVVQEPPQFKITGVHMSGLRTGEDDKKVSWGSQKQKQSGSRWLIAQGMAKTAKHPLLKSKPMPSKTKVKPGDTLWSISSRVHGTGQKWREVAALNPHIRNPDVIFTNDTIRTR